MRAIIIAALSVFAVALTTPLATAQMGGGGSMGSSGPEGPDTDAYDAGIEAYQARNFEEAIRQLQRARRPAPNHGGVNYALGMSYLGLNDKEQALEAFRRAVRDRNAPPSSWLQYGLLSLEAGDRETAAAQQAALERQLSRCSASCGDQRRANLQSAYDQLTQRLAATP
jgi:tetratricopeptide (TPR) repeat protein